MTSVFCELHQHGAMVIVASLTDLAQHSQPRRGDSLGGHICSLTGDFQASTETMI